MSAWIVSDKHISYIVRAAVTYNRHIGGIVWGIDGPQVTFENDTEIALGLINENIKSVNHRYSHHDESTPLRERFSLCTVGKLDPVQVLKAINCYEYQSCEHPEWAGSKAWLLCRRLKEATIAQLPGYDQAEWGL